MASFTNTNPQPYHEKHEDNYLQQLVLVKKLSNKELVVLYKEHHGGRNYYWSKGLGGLPKIQISNEVLEAELFKRLPYYNEHNKKD